MSYRTLGVKELLECLEDEPDNESLQAARDDIEELDKNTTLIREDDFVEYAKEFAEKLCDIDTTMNVWPYSYIDWDRAAEALKEDYFDIEIEGITYLYRQY